MYKYLIVISIISKSNRNIQKLRNNFSAISYEDEFTKLFNSIYEEFNLENTHNLIALCGELMKSDYFLSDYVDVFAAKCKELSIEHHINLNTKIDLKSFSKFVDNDESKIRIFVENFIKSNFVDSEIAVNGDVISYRVKDAAKENEV
jgi:hypothetical protein